MQLAERSGVITRMHHVRVTGLLGLARSPVPVRFTVVACTYEAPLAGTGALVQDGKLELQGVDRQPPILRQFTTVRNLTEIDARAR